MLDSHGMGYITQCIAFKRATAELNRLESIQPSQKFQKPDVKKNQEICKIAFKELKALDRKVQKNPLISPKKKIAFSSKLVSEAYRLGKNYGGKNRLDQPDPEGLGILTAEALKWKKKQIRFTGNNESLTEEDKTQLAEIARYPACVALCVKKPQFFNEFLNWSILYRLSVRVFVEFPKVSKSIDGALLKGRLEGEDPTLLKFHERKDGVKDVTLPFEGKDVSLLDEKKKVELAKGLILSISQIFKMFANKNLKEGFLTFYKGLGVTNWDSMELGPYNPKTKKVDSIDLTQKNWHRQLRMKATYTTDEATEKFGFRCDGKTWVMTVVASRAEKRLDVLSGHSFFRLAIPRDDDSGIYDYTYGWGKFAKKYPQNGLHAAGYLFAPKKGTLQNPDNNEFYPREKKEFHYPMTPEKGAGCLDSLKDDILMARKNQLSFQFLIKNCTDWLVDKMRTFVGIEESKLFDLPYLKLEPSGFLGTVLKIIRKVPDWLRKCVLNALACVFCGWKRMKVTHENGKKETVSVLKTPPWDLKRPFRHPGVAFRTAAT